jgi:hypothetical protein
VGVTDNRENWVYLVGEMGGGTWAVERPDGRDDLLTYRDLRLLFGWENIPPRPHPLRPPALGRRLQVEAGWVFGRELEFEDSGLTYEPGGTSLIQARFDF